MLDFLDDLPSVAELGEELLHRLDVRQDGLPLRSRLHAVLDGTVSKMRIGVRRAASEMTMTNRSGELKLARQNETARSIQE